MNYECIVPRPCARARASTGSLVNVTQPYGKRKQDIDPPERLSVLEDRKGKSILSELCVIDVIPVILG